MAKRLLLYSGMYLIILRVLLQNILNGARFVHPKQNCVNTKTKFECDIYLINSNPEKQILD